MKWTIHIDMDSRVAHSNRAVLCFRIVIPQSVSESKTKISKLLRWSLVIWEKGMRYGETNSNPFELRPRRSNFLPTDIVGRQAHHKCVEGKRRCWTSVWCALHLHKSTSSLVRVSPKTTKQTQAYTHAHITALFPCSGQNHRSFHFINFFFVQTKLSWWN